MWKSNISGNRKHFLYKIEEYQATSLIYTVPDETGIHSFSSEKYGTS